MQVSVFDIFRIGIGPSSSHTVGPMRAARRFAERLRTDALLGRVTGLRLELHGSLAFTGKGHGSDVALMLGLLGEDPSTVDIESVQAAIEGIGSRRRLRLLKQHDIAFSPQDDIIFNRREKLPLHPNGMRFRASSADGETLLDRVYYSVGGGFVVNGEGLSDEGEGVASRPVPYAFSNADELLRLCSSHGLSISAVMLENEKATRPETQVREGLRSIWQAMGECVARGMVKEGLLPGGLKVRRRAASLHRRLKSDHRSEDPLGAMDWVNLWALAVNEENAAGGRVVTAPTNGAAGVVPAVLHYYRRFVPNADDEGVQRFLLVAGALGALYKTNASLSGAEVGCQGEVGVACSMAAGGLAEALGGTPEQVENAAEIGMEHNLGLTCDPIGGLVQVPCIERNAMGAVKAINAARLALWGDGKHKVSLDKVIETMRQTGADMSTKYKETARGGLAVNIIEC